MTETSTIFAQEFGADFVEIWDTLTSNFSSVSKRLRVSDMDDDIKSICLTMYKRDVLNDKFADISIEEFWGTQEDAVLGFLLLSYLSSYYNFSNIDVTMKFEYDETAGRMVARKNEFGYKGASAILKTLFDGYLGADSDLQESALNKLLSVERSCSAAEYFENKLYIEDIKVVKGLMTSVCVSAGLGNEEKTLLIREFHGVLTGLVSDTVDVYRDLLSGAFGLERYNGVFTFNKAVAVQGLTGNGCIQNISPNKELKNPFSTVLRDSYPCYLPIEGIDVHGQVKKYSDRQFDLRLINLCFRKEMDKENPKPVYFPHKILEIISIMEYTRKQQLEIYKPCGADGKNLDSYLDYLGYVSTKPNEIDAVVKTPFYEEYLNALGYICKSKLREINKRDESNYSIIDLLDDEECPYYKDNSTEVYDWCMKFLGYFFRCFTTCFILTTVTTGSGYAENQIYDFRIKVSHPTSPISNTDYMTRIKEMYSAIQVDISNVTNAGMTSSAHGIYLQDYAYTANPELAFGRPIFAYKALNEMIRQNRPINWDNILLGKSKDGSLITSSKAVSINMQSKRFHYIIAGSRSGKGVMCYNVFATALASGKPIFYMDRKPDTASVMKSISPKMFAINGGDYKAEFDLDGSLSFNPDICKIPSYLQDIFHTGTVAGVKLIGDFAYFRSILLCINLLVFMDNNKTSKDPNYLYLADKLKNGMCVVIDEFTNFTNEFLTPFMNSDGGFFSGLLKMETIDTIVRSYFESISKGIIKRKKLDGKTGSTDMEKKLADDAILNAVDSGELRLDKLYWGAYYDKQIKGYKDVKALKNAAIQYMNNAHFFMIGQDIIPELFDSTLEPRAASGNSTCRFISSNMETVAGRLSNNSFYSFLNTQDSDVILGYQPPDKGVPTYLAQASGNSENNACDLLTLQKRFFCYKAIGNGQLGTEFTKMRNTAAVLGNSARDYANGFQYFKPFLILNNSLTPPCTLRYPNPDNHRDVSVSEELENNRKIGASQYVGQCITSCNRVGLTYDDLYEDNKGGNGDLCQEIGFVEYTSKLLASNADRNNTLEELLGVSGDIMEVFVCNILGYSGSVTEFLYDFRPEWLFCPEDFTAKLINPNSGIPDRLKDSFFRKAILDASADNYNFVSVFKDQLGTLQEYYENTCSFVKDDNITNDDDMLRFDAEEPDIQEGIVADNVIPHFTMEESASFVNRLLVNYDRRKPNSNIKSKVTKDDFNRMTEVVYQYMNS